MGVEVRLNFDNFERAFFQALAEELEASAKIFRRNIATVLRTTGKSPPPSPKGSKIPYNKTGTLARSWHEGKASRKGTKFVAHVGTNVRYALELIERTGSGRRNYMDGRLGWRRKTKGMIVKRLNAQRITAKAAKSFKR